MATTRLEPHTDDEILATYAVMRQLLPQIRSRGFGRQLLEWLKDAVRARRCAEVHLDARVHGEAAHRFDEREGFAKMAYHFAAVL